LIFYIYRGQEIIIKTVYYATNVNFIKAELFTTKYGINHVTYLQDINHIIGITDAILAIKQIFNIIIHLYQLHSITILKNLRKFFNKSSNNSVNCTESIKWSSHLLVDKESRYLEINLYLLL